VEHGGAGVYGVGLKVGIGGHESGEEAAVSVAEDEGLLLLEETREEVQTATLKGATQGEVLEPAVGAGYEIEVGRWLGRARRVYWARQVHRGRKGMKRRGVRRTRSAAARRGRAAMWCRR
jgi:hypothetical protein